MIKTMKQHSTTDTCTFTTLHFLTEDGSAVTTEDWHGQVVLLVFLRWLG
jgi:hypothetical protein